MTKALTTNVKLPLADNENSKKTVWTIAGSDCSGGAGIQADTKTIHNLGAEACCVITAVTAQNQHGVQAINAVSDDVILSQLNALSEINPPSVIKIGLLANTSQVRLIAKQISQLKSNLSNKPFVIYDPVALASNGGRLTQDNLLPEITRLLLPLVDLLTPNKHELQALTKEPVNTWSSLLSASQALLELGVGASIIKGGHIDIVQNKSIDFYSNGSDSYWLCSNTIATDNSHGTGCTFASAIAALLAQDYLIRDAFVIAKAYINQGLSAAKNHNCKYGAVWQGTWPHKLADYPEVLTPGSPLAKGLNWDLNPQQPSSFCSDFASCDSKKLGLYPVVDSLSWLQRLLKLGIKTIQYREKNLKGDQLSTAINQAVKLGEQHQARLFINDYWQLAIEHKAYGVHLGQEDLEGADLTAIKQAGLRLGVSTHGHYELLKIKQYRPSYIAIGAIFPTKTKDMTGQIQGVKTLTQLVDLTPEIPTVAIGGITLDKALSVLKTNVGSIAVVTAITEADNPESVIDQFQQLISRH